MVHSLLERNCLPIGRSAMIKKLWGLLGIAQGPRSEQLAPKPKTKQPGGGDFRAIEILPGSVCCAAATRATGRSYLLRDAPRLPLYGCTRPTVQISQGCGPSPGQATLGESERNTALICRT